MKTLDNNTLIAEFMELEYFEKSKCSIEPYGTHSYFEEEAVWVKGATDLYRRNPIHYGYEYSTITNKYEGEISRDQLFEDYFYVLKYDTSWNWLMPVVEKIENLECCDRLDITKDEVCIWAENYKKVKCRIRFSYGEIYESDYESKIQAVYNAVVEFIKWYNIHTDN